MIKSFVILLLWISIVRFGTDSGNHGIISDTTSEPIAQDFIGEVICQKLAHCDSVNTSICRSSMLTATGITAHLGLDPMVYATLGDAVHAGTSGQLRVNLATLASCQNAIADLACDSALVTSAHSSSQPSDFNQTYLLLSAGMSCSQFLSP